MSREAHRSPNKDKNDKNEDDALAALTAMAAGGKKRGRLVSLEEQGAMSLMSLMEASAADPPVRMDFAGEVEARHILTLGRGGRWEAWSPAHREGAYLMGLIDHRVGTVADKFMITDQQRRLCTRERGILAVAAGKAAVLRDALIRCGGDRSSSDRVGKPSSPDGMVDSSNGAGSNSMPFNRYNDCGQAIPPPLALPISVRVAESLKEYSEVLEVQEAAEVEDAEREEQAASQIWSIGMTVHAITQVAEPSMVESSSAPLFTVPSKADAVVVVEAAFSTTFRATFDALLPESERLGEELKRLNKAHTSLKIVETAGEGKPSSSMKGRMDPIKEAGSMPSSRCGDFGQEMPPLLALPIAVMVAASPKEFDWMLTAQKAADGRKEQAARQPCPSGCAMMTVHTSTLVAEPLVAPSPKTTAPLPAPEPVIGQKRGMSGRVDTDYIGFSAEEADELQATFRALLPVSERLGKELKWLDKVARQAHSQLKIAKTACECTSVIAGLKAKADEASAAVAITRGLSDTASLATQNAERMQIFSRSATKGRGLDRRQRALSRIANI